MISLFLIISLILPQMSKAQEVCDTPAELMSANLPTNEFQAICKKIVETDPGCKLIENKSMQMDCSESADNNSLFSSDDIGSKIFQCMKGFVWDSMVELGSFVIDLIKMMVGASITSATAIYEFMTDSEYREKAMKNIKSGSEKADRLIRSFLSSSAMYFARDYSKNLAKNPFNPAMALSETLLKPLLKMLGDAAVSIYEYYMPQFQCLNGPAKANAICRIGGEIFMPPTILFSFLKFGVKGLKALSAAQLAKIKRATSSLTDMTKLPKKQSIVVKTANATSKPEVIVAKNVTQGTPEKSKVLQVFEEAKMAPVEAEKVVKEYGDLLKRVTVESGEAGVENEVKLAKFIAAQKKKGLSDEAIRKKIKDSLGKCQ